MSSSRETPYYSRRLTAAKAIICVALSLIGVRLWYLQCLNGGYYRDLSENNRRRAIRTQAPRGIVYDREGRVLVRNRPSFNIAVMLEDVQNLDDTVEKVARYSGRTPEEVRAQLKRQRLRRPFEPKVLLHDVERDELARIKVNSHNLPGVIVSTLPTRYYPNRDTAAQLFGYTREISSTQLEQLKDADYRMGDSIGQTGLERQYEAALRGIAGYIQVEVDARGNRKRELGIIDDRSGGDIHLTLDLDLQRAAERALEGKKGAIVAVDPQTGEVLALASTPTFDANLFSGQVLATEWQQLVTDKRRPLTNRAISSVYPPGSTFKLLWAAVALAEKKLTPETRISCPGYYYLGSRRYHCHKKSGHGAVNLREAVMLSCNVFFYTVGQMLGIDVMSKYMEQFGFGQLSGIDLPGESRGTLPSDKWKRQMFGEKWYPGDTLPVAIGQGYIVATPLQMAMYTAAIANDGILYRPHLIKQIVDPRTNTVRRIEPTINRRIDIPPEVFAEVRSYAADVVNQPRGTGKRTKLPGIIVGGKTGTAQVGALGKEHLAEHLQDHAWFVAFAPVEKPRIAMAVIVENSGHGGVFAAPAAKEVLTEFFIKQGLLAPEQLDEDGERPAVAPAPPAQRARAEHGEDHGEDSEPAGETASAAAKKAGASGDA